VTIGSGSIVGGHSVVTSSIPRYTLASGVPAKIIKRRVSWQRDLIPIPALDASPVPQKLATKEDMAQTIKDGDAEGLIFDVDLFMKSTGMNFEDLESYVQFYYARSHYLCKNFRTAKELLLLVVHKNPQHKIAIDLLGKIPIDL
jgi:hypothetical protein